MRQYSQEDFQMGLFAVVKVAAQLSTGIFIRRSQKPFVLNWECTRVLSRSSVRDSLPRLKDFGAETIQVEK